MSLFHKLNKQKFPRTPNISLMNILKNLLRIYWKSKSEVSLCAAVWFLPKNLYHISTIFCSNIEKKISSIFWKDLARGNHKKMNHFQVKSILSILLILATCTMLHVNCSGVNGSNDLKLRLFGIRPKPSKKEQIIMS